MIKSSTFILCACLFLAGCETSQESSDNHYDRVSREIERLKAESEKTASIGNNIKIVVNLLTTSMEDYFAIDSLLQYVDKNITITKRPEVYTQSGLQIGVAGATGYINIGKEIAVPRFFYYGRWYSGVEYEFLQAGRSLRVTARRLPSGLIDMELTPVFSRFLSDGGNLELTELSTRVTARSGQTLVIAGGDSAGENVATALLGYSKMGENKRTLITATPHVQ